MWILINVLEWDVISGKSTIRFIQNWPQLQINPHFVWENAKRPKNQLLSAFSSDFRADVGHQSKSLILPPRPSLTWTLVHLRHVPYKCQLLSVLCRKIRRKGADKGKGKRRGKSVETWIAWSVFFFLLLFIFFV